MLELAAVLVLVVLVGVYLAWQEKTENGGVWFWQRTGLLANGAQTTGLVLDQAAHSPSMARRTRVHLVDLVIELTPSGREKMRVRLRYRLADGEMTRRVDKGRTVPLRYDPRDPARVLVDWDAITGHRPPADPDREQMQKDRARQDALLRGDDP